MANPLTIKQRIDLLKDGFKFHLEPIKSQFSSKPKAPRKKRAPNKPKPPTINTNLFTRIKSVKLAKKKLPRKPYIKKIKVKTTKKIDPRYPDFLKYFLDPASPSFLQEIKSKHRAGFKTIYSFKKYVKTTPKD
jgi:hypothetical protein